jgi:hypothetical protein
MVNNPTNINKNHEVRVFFLFDIGGIVDHPSMSLGER